MTSPFRLQRMDEEEAWRVNYEFIRENYPNLKKKAFDFYLQKVNILIHAISKEQREEFAVQYRFLRRILSKNLTYILFASGLGLKQRVKFLVDYFTL